MPSLDEIRRFPERARTLLAFVEDPVAVITRGQTVIYVNPAFARRFAAGWDQVIGKKLGDVLPRFIAVRVAQHLADLQANSGPRHFWAKRFQESLRVSLAPVTQNGRLIGATLMLWEATGESEVKRMNVSLFRAMLEDIASPIEALDVLLTVNLDRPQRLAEMEGAIRRDLSQITESLSRFKEYTEVLFGNVVPARVHFQPLQLLGLARKTLSGLARSRKVFLEEASARDLPEVQSDPAYLNRVLGLVVDYVIRQVARGQLVVLSADVLTPPASSPLLTYAVTGTGWVPGERLLRSMTDSGQDMYLGKNDEEKRLNLRLFIARRLVQAMNGTFTPAAHEKVGATFAIAIPTSIYSIILMPEEEQAAN